MNSNIGRYERLVRIIFGIFLIIFGFSEQVSSYFSWVSIFIGIIITATGFVGWCGLYSICGISTKGTGINKISRKDIEKAVKEAVIKENLKEDTKKKSTPAKKKTAIKKTSTKKTAPTKKKTTSTKANTSKKTTSTKKTTTKKKAATKKSTK